MPKLTFLVTFLLAGISLAAQVTRDTDVPLKNWQAPLYWQPSSTEIKLSHAQAEIRTPSPEATTPFGSLVFVAMTPCRVVDTRASQGFPAPFGPPSITSGPARSFPLQSSTICSIPSIAQAYSVIVTLVPPGPVGYLSVFPTGAQPNTVTLDDLPGDIRQTGTTISAGTPEGSISAVVSATTDLVIDINGYYAPSTGITLAQGTVSAPSLSFSGDVTTGIFSSGAGSLSLTTGGTAALTVDSTGDVELAGSMRKGGSLFIHTLGGTAIGVGALASNSGINSGVNNTATGEAALARNTMGLNNTAMGHEVLGSNTTGNSNTATGSGTLVAIPNAALASNTTGSYNTANGVAALTNNTTGNNNIGLGVQAGDKITMGSNNIAIGNEGTSNDGTSANSGVIRIGTAGTQTSFFAAGINNSSVSGAAVLVDVTTGQLGIASSSRRYKADIEDMADASEGLLRLRPVTFRYQKPYADGSKPIDYGLIAEEVAKVYPDLVVKNKDGEVETVQYQKLIPMLLNELQKEYAAVEKEHTGLEQAYEMIRALQMQLAALRELIQKP